MGLFTWLFPEERTKEEQIREEPEITPPVGDVLLKALLNNETITRDKALTLPAVSGAVDFISSAVACMSVRLFRSEDGKVEEVENDNRVKLLNGDTGDTLDAFQMKKAMVADYLLGKGGYCYIRKNRNTVTGLFYVEDMYIGIMKTPEPINKDYQIVVLGKQYRPYEFIKLLRNTRDGASGTGLTEEISKELETAYQTLLYQLGMVKSGGNKKGFLKSQRKLGQDEINVLKQAWQNLYGNNTENVVVLNNGLEFQEASNSSVEMQLNESKRTLKDEINDLFHISNDFDQTFKFAIYPIVKAFETALNRDLLLEREKKNMFFSFDVKEIIKASLTERYNSYKTAKETGFMTLNEIRKAENLNWIEGLDVVNVGLGAVLYDVNQHVYYTPNTDTVGDLSDGGSNEQQNMDKMLEGHELEQAYDASGNSAERMVERFNPNHGKDGKFSSGGNGGAWSATVGKMRDEFNGMPTNKKALYLYKNGFMSKEDSLQHMKDGDIDKYGADYFALLEENGDFTPKGKVRDNRNRARDAYDSGEYSDYTEARGALIREDTGFGDAEVEKTQKELQTWFGSSWDKADTETLDRYVASSPAYDGAIYRGLHFDSADELDSFAGGINAGDRLSMRGKNASWTSDEETARGFAHSSDDTYSSVVITCLKNRTSSPVADLSYQGESEVLSSSKAQWTVLRKEEVTRSNGSKKVNIYVVEANTDEP